MRYERVFLIGNPIAGGGALRKIELAERILRERGIPFETLLTEKKGDAEEFAQRIREKYSRNVLVLAAGGDGTYNEVVNGLAFSEIPLAILPAGTTSVLAKELRVSKRMDRAIEYALCGKVERVNLGEIKNKDRRRLFVLMAGVGFDGEAVYRVERRGRVPLKKLVYFLSGLSTLLRFSSPELTVLNGETKRGYTVVVAKASCYGGDFKIAPDVDLRKPYFYVFLSKTKSKIGIIKHILGIATGLHRTMKDTDYFRAESLRIYGDAHVQIDGDYFGKAPVEVVLVKDALNLVFPEGS